jgi:hypothetical protein
MIKLERNAGKLYTSINSESKKEAVEMYNGFQAILYKNIHDDFVLENDIENIVRVFIDVAINEEKDAKEGKEDPITYMYLRMLDRIINGDERYVGYVTDLTSFGTDNFAIDSSKLIIIFDALKYDICVRSVDVNGRPEVKSLITSNPIDFDYYDRQEHVHVLDIGKLCGDKLFSRESIKELDCMIDHVLKKYMSFYLDLFKKPSDDIKQIIK